MGDNGFRWVTVAHPAHRELEITLMLPGPPLESTTPTPSGALANGTHGSLGLRTENCQKSFEERTGKGVEFVQPPAERLYRTEAIIRDNSGNWLVLVEPKEYSPDFA